MFSSILFFVILEINNNCFLNFFSQHYNAIPDTLVMYAVFICLCLCVFGHFIVLTAFQDFADFVIQDIFCFMNITIK